MSLKMFRKVVVIGSVVALAGCGDPAATSSDGGGDLASTGSGGDGGSDGGDGGGTAAPTHAVVVAGDFNSPLGSLSTVRLADRSVDKSLDTTLDSDSVVRSFGGKVYVLSRLKGVLRIYDPAKAFAGVVEIVTGDSMVKHDLTDPTDVLPVEGTSRVYVALYTNDAAHAVGVIDTARPGDGVTKWIAVPASAKSPLPRPTLLWRCGKLVYLLLEDLDDKYAVTGPGRVAVIDPATDRLVEDGQPSVFALATQNPAGGFPYSMASLGGACDDVLVGAAGDLSGKTNDMGGIEHVSLASRKSLGVLFTGTDLGGNVGSIAVANAHVMYAVVGAFPNKVVALDPTDKKVLGAVLGPANFIPFVYLSPDGATVFVGVNGSEKGQAAAGLYVAPADGKPITSTPLTFDQPPYGMALY